MNTKTLLLVMMLAALASSSCAASPASPPTATQVPLSPTPMPPTPTHTATPTIPPPAITVSEPVECTTGPGQGYSVVATLEAGEQVEVAGQDAAGGYWIVLDPVAQQGCWVERTQVSFQGDGSGLPELIPGPTQPARPDAPANFAAKGECNKRVKGRMVRYDVTVTLSWEEKSAYETGFEIFKNRAPYKIVDANTTTINDAFTFSSPVSGSVLYWIRAVNDNGKSARVETLATYRCK